MKAIIRKDCTSDRIDWDEATALVRKLYRNGDYKMSLLIGCGIFTCLRISDLLRLTWNMLLSDDSFTIWELKTGKKRIIKINKDFQSHIKKCHDALNISDDDSFCFLSQKKSVYSTQHVNLLLKRIKKEYNVKCQHFSTHSLRKTGSYAIYTNSKENAELALVKLSQMLNHSSVAITRRYLGITQAEIALEFDKLQF